jgi:hypothetical protein
MPILKPATRTALIDMIEIEFERPRDSRDYTKVQSAALALIADRLDRTTDILDRIGDAVDRI